MHPLLGLQREPSQKPPRSVRNRVAQSAVCSPFPDPEGLFEVLDRDGGVWRIRNHTRSAKLRVKRSNTRRPPTRSAAVTATEIAITSSAGAGPPSRPQRNPSTTATIGLRE